MNRTSTLALIALIALIAFLIWSGKFGFLNSNNTVDEAIPENSLISLNVNDLEQFRQIANESKFIKGFKALAWVDNFEKTSALINELLNLELGNFKKQNIVASLHAVRSGQYGFLYLIDSKNIGTNPFKLFRRSLKGDSDQITTSRYKKTLIYHTKTGLDNFSNMVFSECQGIILFSKHATLVEEGIKAITEGNVINSSIVPSYKHSNNPNSLGFLLNANNLKLLSTPEELRDKSLMNNQLSEIINSFNGDLIINKNRLVANGKINIQNNEWLKTMLRHSPVNVPSLFKKIPSDCVSFTYNSVSSFTDFFNDYLESINSLKAEKFTPYLIGIGNEFAKLKMSEKSTDVFVISINNIDVLKNNYHKISATFNSGNNFEIRKLDDNEFGNLLVKERNDNYYYAIVGSALIISASKSEISKQIDKIVSGNSFDKTAFYTSYKNNFMLKSSIIHFENPKMLQNYYNNGWEELANRKVSLENFYPLFIQLFEVKNEFNVNAVLGIDGSGLDEKMEFEIKKSPIYKDRPQVVSKNKTERFENYNIWTELLTEKPAIPAQKFVNHYTQEPETFIQDINNTLYLVNKENEILWRRNINSTVKTPIIMVDFLNNKKNQLMFNTEDKVQLLDRNGNTVKPFPKLLAEKAQNAISKVYYRDAKKERYYYVGQNGRTYALDKYGEIVKGWLNNINVGKVDLPMVYTSLSGKDHLCFINRNSEIYIFNRKGELRRDPIRLNMKASPKSFEISEEKNSLIIIDIKGNKTRHQLF